MNWFAHTLWIMMSSVSIANWLTAEAGLFIGIIALALWVMKITVSTYWLTVLGEIARAITTAVIQVTSQIGLLVLAVPIGVFAGVTTIRRGEAGRGWTMILLALTMPALSVAVFADPAGMMYGQDGLLAFGRRVGFQRRRSRHPQRRQRVAPDDTLTASLITHAVREPLQVCNFGHVVDRVGSCGAAWSAAVRTGVSDGPVKAMAGCGDRSAVRLRPAPRRHQSVDRGGVRVRRGAARRVHGGFRVGGAHSLGEGDLDHRDPAAVAVGGKRAGRAAAPRPRRRVAVFPPRHRGHGLHHLRQRDRPGRGTQSSPIRCRRNWAARTRSRTC